MSEEFDSKVYIGNGGGSLALRILLFAVSAVITAAVLIKVAAGDFRTSDVTGILLALLAIAIGRTRIGSRPRYAFVRGSIEFEGERMVIRYGDVDGGKKIGRFDESYDICYDEIERMEFGRDLSCFRILARCRHDRIYHDFGKERRQTLANREKTEEIFLYVLEDAEDMRDKLQRNAGCAVRVLEGPGAE